MNPDAAAKALILEADRYLGVTESPPGSNRGTAVDYWVQEAGLDPAGGYPWCAAFVGQVGRQALGRAWPCPRTASVAALVRWAEGLHEVLTTAPAVGDLFALWEPALTPPRFGHTGIVTAVLSGGRFQTVEGNTNPDGSREGYGVFVRRRSAATTNRYIRWVRALTVL